MVQESNLLIDNVSFGYANNNRATVVIQSNLTLNFEAKQLYAIMGKNGVGKSTIVKTLSGFIPPMSGMISLNKHNIKSLSLIELARMRAVVTTEKIDNGFLTVFDLIGLGQLPYRNDHSETKRIIHSAAEACLVSSLLDRSIDELSDGQKQLVMIARALAQDCPLMILDEPTAFLDISHQIKIFRVLKQLASEQHKTIILTTHDWHNAIDFCDKMVLLQFGQVPPIVGQPTVLLENSAIANTLLDPEMTINPATRQIKLKANL